MREFRLINIEWNTYNRCIVELLGINDRNLFGFNSSLIKRHRFLYIDLFYFNIKVFDESD